MKSCLLILSLINTFLCVSCNSNKQDILPSYKIVADYWKSKLNKITNESRDTTNELSLLNKLDSVYPNIIQKAIFLNDTLPIKNVYLTLFYMPAESTLLLGFVFECNSYRVDIEYDVSENTLYQHVINSEKKELSIEFDTIFKKSNEIQIRNNELDDHNFVRIYTKINNGKILSTQTTR